jgi:Tfp pilus assembly protein PilN
MDLQMTNVWLAILAISSALQLVGVCVGVMTIMRRMRRAEQAIDLLTREAQPIIHRVTAALDDVADLSARLRRADDAVTTTIERVGTGVDRLKLIALTRVWPTVGVARGLRAAAAALRERRRTRQRREDTMAENRFMNEGGAHAGPIRS